MDPELNIDTETFQKVSTEGLEMPKGVRLATIEPEKLLGIIENHTLTIKWGAVTIGCPTGQVRSEDLIQVMQAANKDGSEPFVFSKDNPEGRKILNIKGDIEEATVSNGKLTLYGHDRPTNTLIIFDEDFDPNEPEGSGQLLNISSGLKSLKKGGTNTDNVKLNIIVIAVVAGYFHELAIQQGYQLN